MVKPIPINIYKNDSELNIAGFFPVSKSLGPEQRALLWLQGCLKNCRGCITPEMRAVKTKEFVHAETMAGLIAEIQGCAGVTVIGGEPMLQVPALSLLFSLLKNKYKKTTMVYTGYYIEELMQTDDEKMTLLLDNTDILIDGPYVHSLDYSQKWRGSENQRIHFLTEYYKQWQWVMDIRKRDVEIHVNDYGQYMLLGIPTKELYNYYYKNNE